jgi:hypothetical protein
MRWGLSRESFGQVNRDDTQSPARYLYFVVESELHQQVRPGPPEGMSRPGCAACCARSPPGIPRPVGGQVMRWGEGSQEAHPMTRGRTANASCRGSMSRRGRCWGICPGTSRNRTPRSFGRSSPRRLRGRFRRARRWRSRHPGRRHARPPGCAPRGRLNLSGAPLHPRSLPRTRGRAVQRPCPRWPVRCTSAARGRRCDRRHGAAGWTARRRRGGPQRVVVEGVATRREASRRGMA